MIPAPPLAARCTVGVGAGVRGIVIGAALLAAAAWVAGPTTTWPADVPAAAGWTGDATSAARSMGDAPAISEWTGDATPAAGWSSDATLAARGYRPSLGHVVEHERTTAGRGQGGREPLRRTRPGRSAGANGR